MTSTLTLSAIELEVVQVYLDAAMERISDVHVDREILRGLMLTFRQGRVIPLTQDHVRVMLRHLRSRHALLDADMMGLEERMIRGGYDGVLDAQWRVLDADSVLIADVIRRLWEILT